MKTKIKNPSSSYAELDELITRVFCDTSPDGSVDVAYLFGETKDNEMSVLKAALFLYGAGPAEKIALCGMPGGHGFPGFSNWKRKLIAMGIPESDLVPIRLADDFPPSTDAEALGLVRHAKEEGWRSIYVVAPPLHQLRAFMSTVSAAIHEKAKLKIYSFHGIAQKWEDHIVHSQGVQKGTRSELLAAELKKIEKYQKKGDMLSVQDILAYLDKRDGK